MFMDKYLIPGEEPFNISSQSQLHFHIQPTRGAQTGFGQSNPHSEDSSSDIHCIPALPLLPGPEVWPQV